MKILDKLQNNLKYTPIIMVILILSTSVFSYCYAQNYQPYNNASKNTPFTIDGKLVKNDKIGGYDLMVEIAPNSGVGNGFVMFDKNQMDEFSSNLIAQLSYNGFTLNQNYKYLISVAPNDLFNNNNLKMIDFIIAAPSDFAGYVDNVEEFGYAGLALTSYNAYDDNLNPTKPPAPPEIVASFVNWVSYSIPAAFENDIERYSFYDVTNNKAYDPKYIVGTGQKIVITIPGITNIRSFSSIIPINFDYNLYTINSLTAGAGGLTTSGVQVIPHSGEVDFVIIDNIELINQFAKLLGISHMMQQFFSIIQQYSVSSIMID